VFSQPADRTADQVRAGDQPQDTKAFRLTIPPGVLALARADEVIE
jgi:hypothetical protein